MPQHLTHVPPSTPATIDPNIVIINQSTAVNNSAFNAGTAGVITQAGAEFKNAWKVNSVITTDTSVAVGQWPIYIVNTFPSPYNTSAYTGSRGFHTLDANNLPVGYVKATQSDNTTLDPLWTKTLSHEVLEMIINPNTKAFYEGPAPVNTAVTLNVPLGSCLYLLEVCDPVQHLYYTDVNGVALSDFVFPAWFSGKAGPWDYASFRGWGAFTTAPYQLNYLTAAQGGTPTAKNVNDIEIYVPAIDAFCFYYVDGDGTKHVNIISQRKPPWNYKDLKRWMKSFKMPIASANTGLLAINSQTGGLTQFSSGVSDID